MNRFVDNVLIVVLGFVVTFISTGTINWVTLENGSISIGSPLSISRVWHVPVQIRNYRSKPLPGLEFTIPKPASVTDIISSFPVHIEEVASTSGVNTVMKLRITGIQEKRTVDFLVPVSALEKAELVTFLNANANDVILNSSEALDSPKIRLLKRSLETSIIYAVLFAAYLVIMFRFNQGIHKKIEESSRELESARSEVLSTKTESETKIAEVRNDLKRIQLLLIKRINDYEKELSFWRDAIRRVIYSIGEDKKAAQNFLLQITKGLKTYGTLFLKDEYGFEAVQTMANEIAADRNASRPLFLPDEQDSSNKTNSADAKSRAAD